MTLRRLLLATCAMTALAASAPAVAPAAIPAAAEYSEAYFPSVDGTVLHADVLRPKGLPKDARTPVILTVSPYTGHLGQNQPDPAELDGEGPNARFDDFILGAKVLERGYTYVYVDLRGFGGSAGCNDWGGPGEQMDVKAAVEWAASQPWSTGKVGLYGKSYDGWTGLMGLAQQPKGLAAVVSMEPVFDGYRYLYMNGVRFLNSISTNVLFSVIDAQPGRPTDSTQYHLNGTALNGGCYLLNIGQQQQDDPNVDFWKVRNLVDKVGHVTTPLLLTQGFLEDNTKPDAAFAFWNSLDGTQNRAWFGPWDHVRGNDRQGGEPDGALLIGRAGWFDEVMRFLDHHVKGVPLVDAPVDKDPKIAVQGSDGAWRAETQWPPADAQAAIANLKPGTFMDDGANNGTGADAGKGIWTFSAPLPHAAHLAGTPRVVAEVAAGVPRANLVADVYDVTGDGQATLVSRAAMLVRQSGRVELELYGADWKFAAGHRIGVLLSSSNAEWWTHLPTNTMVTVSSARIVLPFLRFTRPSDLPGTKAAKLENYLAGAPFAVSADTIAAGTDAGFPIPAAQVPRPVAAVTPAPPASPRGRLVAQIGRRGRSIVVFGTAPAKARVTVQVQRATRKGTRTVYRTVATRRTTAKLGSFRVSAPVARRSGLRFRALVRAVRGGTKLSARTRTLTVRLPARHR
jgi:predicted acyl esterase